VASDRKNDDSKDDVVRFDAGLIKKLRGDLSAATQDREEIINGSRLYWQRVQAVHEAVLLLMEAGQLEQAHSVLQEDVARLLGFDAVTVIFERLASDAVGPHSALLRPVPPLPGREAQDVVVVEAGDILQTLLPEQSEQMAFALCLPLMAGERRGLLVMANRNPQYLSAGMALEPYVFLARSLSRLGKTWLG
jgi:hypothetical protein